MELTQEKKIYLGTDSAMTHSVRFQNNETKDIIQKFPWRLIKMAKSKIAIIVWLLYTYHAVIMHLMLLFFCEA